MLLLLEGCRPTTVLLLLILIRVRVFALGVLLHSIVDGQPAQVGTQQKSAEQFLLCFVLDLLRFLKTVGVLHLSGQTGARLDCRFLMWRIHRLG